MHFRCAWADVAQFLRGKFWLGCVFSSVLQLVEFDSWTSDTLVTGYLIWGRIGRELLQGLLEVKVEALEKFRVVWTPSRKQLLCCYLVALGLEHVIRRASLWNLVLDPSLLSLQQATVLARQGCCLPNKEVGYFAYRLIVLVIRLNTTVWRCPSEFRMATEAT